ncbi:MAG TPA: DinB family protein [Symbiobacteriaceae bacterium]|nr:DinB family protein [Symbiobacteriaceae bacterium]
MRAADPFAYRHELRAGLLKAVTHLPDAHWDWRPSGGVHCIRSWLRHLAQAEDWWIQVVVQGRKDFQVPRRSRGNEQVEVLSYLEQTRAATEAALRETTAWEEPRTLPTPAPAGLQGRTMTVYEVFHRVFQHEVHHRAQVYLYLRLMGLEPPLA